MNFAFWEKIKKEMEFYVPGLIYAQGITQCIYVFPVLFNRPRTFWQAHIEEKNRKRFEF